MFKVILLIETSSSYGRALLRGIAKYSSLNGPWTFYRKPPFYINPKDTKKQIKQLKDAGADGIIMRSGLETEKILSGEVLIFNILTNRHYLYKVILNPKNRIIENFN